VPGLRHSRPIELAGGSMPESGGASAAGQAPPGPIQFDGIPDAGGVAGVPV
jgi:hypothetical protein